MWPPTGLIPWFSKTEGNTYATLLHHPFLFMGKPMHAQEVARRISGAVAGEAYAKSSQDLISRQHADFWHRCRADLHQVKSRFVLPTTSHFWRHCWGDLRTSQDIPSTHHKLLSLALQYSPFASRFPLPHFTFAILFALLLFVFSFALMSYLARLLVWLE